MRLGKMRAGLLAVVLLGAGCGDDRDGDDSASGDTTTTVEKTTTTESEPTTTTEATTTTAAVLRYPSGDEVFPGYPLVVPVSTIDSRVASWFEGQLVDGQVVALAPGVYRPFNPNVPDLEDYLDGPNDGDCLMREQFFPDSGGACWDGVQKGSAEP